MEPYLISTITVAIGERLSKLAIWPISPAARLLSAEILLSLNDSGLTGRNVQEVKDMPFVETWSLHFDSHIRMQGREYQSTGRVKLLPVQQGEWIRALVHGSRIYTVTITGRDASAIVRCTCPQFEQSIYCKHIWATILEVHKQNSESGSQSQDIDHIALSPPKARKRNTNHREPKIKESDWIGRLSLLHSAETATEEPIPTVLPNYRQICYRINAELSRRYHGVVVELRHRLTSDTGWNQAKPFRLKPEILSELTDPADRELCALLLGSNAVGTDDRTGSYRPDRTHWIYRLPQSASKMMLQRMIETDRCMLYGEDSVSDALSWDGGKEPWTIWLVGSHHEAGLDINVEFRRGSEQMCVEYPTLALGGPDALIFYDDKAAPLNDCNAFQWINQFRDKHRLHRPQATINIPNKEIASFLDRLYLLPDLPEIDLPPQLGRTEQKVIPVPHLDLFGGDADGGKQLIAKIWFAYRHHQIIPGQRGRFIGGAPPDLDATQHSTPKLIGAAAMTDQTQLIRRDLRMENQLLAALVSLGFRRPPKDGDNPDTFAVLPAKLMAKAARELIDRGWIVTIDHNELRNPGTPSLSVTSRIDWFELQGNIPFQHNGIEEAISLPTILTAVRKGRTVVTLSDGSMGLLPQQWLTDNAMLTSLGKVEGDSVKFTSGQAVLLDTLLENQPITEVDTKFAEIRRRLHQFDSIEPQEPTESFQGKLRPYQCEGLSWLVFLRKFGLNGILADDMGLGKTVQVLAMLDAHYNSQYKTHQSQQLPSTSNAPESGQEHRPSLIVVPLSVVFNWIQETHRFCPNLRVNTYTGPERHQDCSNFMDYDLIITSYGVMRRDIGELSKHLFEYAVLDEAQTIKNPNSQLAKAARLLNASHRLALSGTPVENHLGDLWSIFEFLNRGLLGSNARFAKIIRKSPIALSNADNGKIEAKTAIRVVQALRPFILRRTKQQVLNELPEKTEQTILCEMGSAQRRVYDHLRSYFRGTLLHHLDRRASEKLGRSSTMVFEALLRLRQAACHPALIDPKRHKQPSAKLDVLLERLGDLIEEGHKALVFSQFTSLLALVKPRLAERGIKFEYLDGKTRKRQQVVERFQSDLNCPVFLLSIKAGGQGLNLTAADYVFILDPWWNPAVETQAIDRTHRIGQTRHVFAYRLICENTVEQRIMELQDKKRKLANAIIGGQNNLLRNLTRHDLEQLLS